MRILIISMLLSMSVFAEENNQLVLDDADQIFELTGELSEMLTGQFIEKLNSFEGDELIIFINSPGGSLKEMYEIINAMHSSNVKFTCLAQYAASASFMIFENCDKRIMIKNGVLMSHQAWGQYSGNLLSIISKASMGQRGWESMEKYVSTRIGMSHEEYTLKILKTWWIDENEAIKYNLIDGPITYVSCTEELSKKKFTRKEIWSDLYGKKLVVIEKSSCPLIQIGLQVEEK